MSRFQVPFRRIANQKVEQLRRYGEQIDRNFLEVENQFRRVPVLVEPPRVLTSAQNSVTFSNIPLWVKNVELRWSLHSNGSGTGIANTAVRFNNDLVSGNHVRRFSDDFGAFATATGTAVFVGKLDAGNAAGRSQGQANISDINDSTSLRPFVIAHDVISTSITMGTFRTGTGLYTPNSPVTTIEFLTSSGNFGIGSVVYFYGYP